MFWQINVSRTSLPPKTIPWAEASAYLDKRAAGNTLSSAASTVCPLTMARIELMPEALDDLDRIVNHLVQSKAVNIPKKIAEIQQAISVLQTSPRIGHAISNDKRELLIGQRRHGYVAVYSYLADIDCVFVLTIQSQRQQR
jgi:plasmid stabilization system protein ParE